MSRDHPFFTADERQMLEQTALVRHPLEEQYADLGQQHEAAATGMWVFLATEVMFFGALFLSLGAYRYLYGQPFEMASGRLNWVIGGINTAVLLVSSLMMALSVHYAKLGQRKRLVVFLGLTALLGMTFLALKGLEYYGDFADNLVPGLRFQTSEWTDQGLRPDQVPEVKLFLFMYWIMTGLHGLHVTIGIAAVLVMMVLAAREHFSPVYYSPVDVTGLYWHFVDIVWIFLLPMLYLQGTHRF